jgi:hypothetical protein
VYIAALTSEGIYHQGDKQGGFLRQIKALAQNKKGGIDENTSI